MKLWPILCSVGLCVARSLVVVYIVAAKKLGIIADCLHNFVIELNHLLTEGLTVVVIQFCVIIDCFLCDAPARSLVTKNVKSHNGYQGCDKCTLEGLDINNRMTFPETICNLRTDDDYK